MNEMSPKKPQKASIHPILKNLGRVFLMTLALFLMLGVIQTSAALNSTSSADTKISYLLQNPIYKQRQSMAAAVNAPLITAVDDLYEIEQDDLLVANPNIGVLANAMTATLSQLWYLKF